MRGPSNRGKCTTQLSRHRPVLEATRLLGKPFAQPLFRVVLWNFAFDGCVQSVPYFFEDVEMILNIFK